MNASPYLAGWKSIAKHLRISVRTAVRLRERGLPVAQVVKNGTVIAKVEDLDEWAEERELRKRKG